MPPLSLPDDVADIFKDVKFKDEEESEGTGGGRVS